MGRKRTRETIIGERFNRLIVLEEAEGKDRPVNCKCDCGNEVVVKFKHLTTGNTKSCGCLEREKLLKRNTTHGMRGIRIYRIWNNIKNRCTNKGMINYKYYGGRGITFDPKRETFEGFFEDMNDSYMDHCRIYGETNTSIDRMDNNGNYYKGNCKRATRKQQANNMRSNIKNKF